VYFQTKNSNLGKFLSVWQIKMEDGAKFYSHLVYFTTI
jgi:hypothetical protein